jgi:hypothetical protein
MTPLRQRFIDDMRVCNYAAKTIEAYVAGVAGPGPTLQLPARPTRPRPDPRLPTRPHPPPGRVLEPVQSDRLRVAAVLSGHRRPTRARWLEREAGYLLPVEYYHVVFTLPAEVGELALANRVALYDLVFRAAAATLREVAADPNRLGAQVGVLFPSSILANSAAMRRISGSFNRDFTRS